MISCLRVSNLAIIEHLEVEFSGGLNIVTGETGAGKSILATALSIVLGGKARPDLVRTGCDTAEVEAIFDVPKGSPVEGRMKALGLVDTDELLVRRVIFTTGKSRVHVNGTLVTLAQLAELVAGLVDVSSQHAHHSLLDPSSHLEFVDGFGGVHRLRDAMSAAYAEALQGSRRVEELKALASDRTQRCELLTFQLKELESAGLRLGEQQELEAERSRLRHSTMLRDAAERIEEQVYSRDGSMTEELSRLLSQLAEASEHDATLSEPHQRLSEALSTLEDVAKELGRYARTISAEPERLAEVEDRLALLQRVTRRYGGSMEVAHERLLTLRQELSDLESFEERLLLAERQAEAAGRQALAVARELSSKRSQAADALAKAVTAELRELGMSAAVLNVVQTPLHGKGGLIVDGAKLAASGIDEVEFFLAPNAGEPGRALAKAASGGELSRTLLALKCVSRESGHATAYLFDEIDTGVGGAVAEVIGAKLRSVAEHHQVLCITHLAQIAAFADCHLLVEKRVVAERTQSTVRALPGEEQLQEVARMLGGARITENTLSTAAEMLEIGRRPAQARRPALRLARAS